MKRIVRKSLRSGVRDAQKLLETVLIAELIRPSPRLWLISPWISNLPVVDNRAGSFRTICADAGERYLRLADVLIRIAEAGSEVSVRISAHPHNQSFLNALSSVDPTGRVSVTTIGRLHEKMLVGDDYFISGSMNFTVSGLQHNDEQLALETDPQLVAQMKLQLQDEDDARA